jgi:ABC-type Fe3+-hydroxamate transport system substrate-binding protein
MRVVSLVPSLTETLFDIGAGEDVVGVTDWCIFPPGLDRPRVGGTKNPKVEKIRELAPDVVYMNSEENLKRHADAIAQFANVVVTEPKSVDDVISLLEQLGAAHGCDVSAWTERIRAARKHVADFTFAVPIWKKPWMWCGGDTYVSNLVESVGGRNVVADRLRYPSLDIAEMLATEPEVIFLPDEPYAFTADDARAIDHPRVIGPFPGHLFTWHGTRTALGLEWLANALRRI